MSDERTGARILAVDDERDMLRLLQRFVSEETPHALQTADNGDEALELFQQEACDLVITDLRMPGLDGIRFLEEIRRRCDDVPVIILTAYATVETAVEAVRKGAFDYLTKPFRKERLLLTIEKALAWRRLTRENTQLKTVLSRRGKPGRLVGASPGLQNVMEKARQAAATDATVLITGPSGSGKEVLARFIHEQSPRARQHLVTVNCTAIPESVLESELFGHVKGAFTGAWKDKRGLVEEAAGGTLFLDEIGDLDPVLQTKLLRLLQEGEYKPVGSVTSRQADIRFLAATHRDLRAALREGSFREDLYYRLNVVHLDLPPLRDRREDIPLLARHFLRKHAGHRIGPITGISPAALQALQTHDFPGNVRELENVIERAVIFCSGDTLKLGDLNLEESTWSPPMISESTSELPFREARERFLAVFHRQYIEQMLQAVEGNVSQAAERAGIQRQYLHRLMKDLDIDADDFRRA